MTRLRCVGLVLVTLVPVTAAPRAAHGQLTLQAAVDATVTGNSHVRSEWLKTEAFKGQVLARSAPFDAQLQTTVQQGHGNRLIQPMQSAVEQSTTYRVAVVRRLRSGVTLAPSLQVTRSQLALPGAYAAGSSGAGFDVLVPLMYDRGGAVTATAERVAELDLTAVRASWRATVANNVNAAVNAYWSYVAAAARLEVQRDAEARAVRLLDETTQLVEKEERAPADLQQLRATAAARRGARILAEQAVVEAGIQLGTIMGLDAADVVAIPAAATAFPRPTAGSAPVATAISRLVDTASARRPDRARQRVSIRARELDRRGYRNAALPRLDVVVTIGYQGFTQGPGFDHLVSPLYRNVPGLNATVQLRYDVAVANSAARGQLMQEAASVNQSHLALRDIERQIVTDVQVAALGVDRSARALGESERAVDLYRLSVDNEKHKLQLGMNTLFDVLSAEDALTNALLTTINNRRTYAVALAALRLATGTIVDFAAETPYVDAERLLTTP
jgi:outer membrane protein TolC